MNNELSEYKRKIENYSKEQLEDILISLNKDKFPEKYELVKEVLANNFYSKSSVTKTYEPEPQRIEEHETKEEASPEARETNAEQPLKKVEVSTKIKKTPSLDFNKDQTPTGNVPGLLIFLALISSVAAVYVLLMCIVELPGKSLILNVIKKLPVFIN